MTNCIQSVFKSPIISRAEIVVIRAASVTNYSREVTPVYYPNHGGFNVEKASFCNVTVSYTHPGDGDLVTSEAWLPDTGWNSRLQAAGGSGLGPGRFDLSYGAMTGAIGEGYATISTDAEISNPLDPYSWVLNSLGEVDTVAIQHLGGDTLNDMAMIAKSVIQDFYGKPPDYSYFNGCSQGGRQGFEMAQRHPTAYNGITASAPAIHWAQWAPAMFWPQILVKIMGEYPRGCELDTLTSLAVQECDGDDGVRNGIVLTPKTCSFDPFQYVGTGFFCATENRSTMISRAAAIIASASWYGVSHGTDLSSDVTGTRIAATKCNENLCKSNPVPLTYQWIQIFVEKNPEYNYTAMAWEEFGKIMRQSGAEYDSVVAGSNPNLTEFYKNGGKMLTYHGLVQSPAPIFRGVLLIIPTCSTTRLYQYKPPKTTTIALRGLSTMYRTFIASTKSRALHTAFEMDSRRPLFIVLRAWVENGMAPNNLPTTFTNGYRKINNRIICLYPERAIFKEDCGSTNDTACFVYAAKL
ncbi:Tannase/feruloyl esterase [Biscogniauxia marginata]|nr:Tannase/feruloyl esterase [Biscogniauxia marginata]